jgi:hypothetical protein
VLKEYCYKEAAEEKSTIYKLLEEEDNQTKIISAKKTLAAEPVFLLFSALVPILHSNFCNILIS